ncbi:MAG: hypothetical protein M3Z16_10595 [Pseudomonadota bacterium]|nr:hypothetical protein [Pseudomonadota bacterium]
MLLDASRESIEASGMYMLRFGGGAAQTVIRRVERLLSKPTAVRLSAGSGAPFEAELLPFKDGQIKNVTVLGRVVAVLRQL